MTENEIIKLISLLYTEDWGSVDWSKVKLPKWNLKSRK